MSLDIECKDVICALSSAPGVGAIGVIRASGPMAFSILKKIFRRHHSGETRPFLATHGCVIDEHGAMIDDVLAIYFPHGKSFTGEECFEIHCHGNGLIVDQILSLICRHGARLAEPGEFSLRAVLNDKIDLTQAESIADLIHAKSEQARDVALKGLRGGLRKKLDPTYQAIVAVLAEIEARMDFPDEDLGTYDKEHLSLLLHTSIEELDQLLINAEHALRLHEGARLVICGLPNAGKSTLFNRLCQEERAIVHETAGTTRDVIEMAFKINGIVVVAVDVAGIRHERDTDAIERMGIERAYLELDRAHIIIWLADSTTDAPFGDPFIENQLRHVSAPVLRVLNKVELLKDAPRRSDALFISAKEGIGIDELKELIFAHLTRNNSPNGELFITRARQRHEIEEARDALVTARMALLENLADEVITSELRQAGIAFDRLFGTQMAEDVLDKIFKDFCIGK